MSQLLGLAMLVKLLMFKFKITRRIQLLSPLLCVSCKSEETEAVINSSDKTNETRLYIPVFYFIRLRHKF